jgi:Rrf2 family nitric oxide-sensitive transcriptional repressor
MGYLICLLIVKVAVQLTSYTDYSLRVLMYLAVCRRPLATIEEIAAAYGISHAHLTKVVQELSALGLVATVRGRRGGLRLARPPERVNVGQLIRRTEQFPLVECFRSDGDCVITPACGLRAVLDEALDAFLAVVDRYTLADLVARRPGALARLLDTGP